MPGIKVRALANPGAARAIRDALLSLPDNERMFIISDPGIGEHRVFELHRSNKGNPKYDYETEPES